MNKLHVAVNELENAISKNADKTQLKPIFQKIEEAAKEPKTREHKNERGENGIQALWRVLQEVKEDLKKDFQEFKAALSGYQDAGTQKSPSTFTMDKLEQVMGQVESANDLRETLEASYQAGGKNIDNFKAYFEAFQAEKAESGFAVTIRNLDRTAQNLNDRETLKNWYGLSQSLDCLKNDGLIEKLDVDKLSAKTGFSIVSQAWENLNQNQEKSSSNDEAEEQEQHQSQTR